MTKDAQTREKFLPAELVIPAFIAAFFIGIAALCLWASPHRLQAGSPTQPLAEIRSWTALQPLPIEIANRNAIIYKNHLMVFGGKNSLGKSVQDVYSAPILADGTLGRWSAASQLREPLYLHSLAVFNQFVYVIGGWNENASEDKNKPNNTIWRGVLTDDGRVSSWEDTGTYKTVVTLHKSVVIGQRLYSFGGYDNESNRPLSAVYYIDLDPTTGHLLGDWQIGPSLPEPLRRFSLTKATIDGKSFVYITGGSGQADNSAFDSVYYSAVNDDGTLAEWQIGPDLIDGRYYHDSVIHDGQLLVIGGKNRDGEYGTVWSAPIGNDGALGNWISLTPLPSTLYRFAAVKMNRYGSDFVFAIGGYVDTAVQSMVYRSTFPNTPTPTPTATATNTPTPTPTFTPTPPIDVQFSHEPSGWIGPGEEVKYNIEFTVLDEPISSVRIESEIPEGLDFVGNSISASSVYPVTITQNSINWQIGDLDSQAKGEISYRLRRHAPVVPSNSPQKVFQLSLNGPAQAEPDTPFDYSIVLVNRSAIPFTNIVVTNTLPFAATYRQGGGDLTEENEVVWTLPIIAPFAAETFTYTISAQQTVLNNHYGVSSTEGARADGTDYIWTEIANTRPIVGDAFTIIHESPEVSWSFNERDGTYNGTRLMNPSISTFLPYLSSSK